VGPRFFQQALDYVKDMQPGTNADMGQKPVFCLLLGCLSVFGMIPGSLL
jgi:hypothetical protein